MDVLYGCSGRVCPVDFVVEEETVICHGERLNTRIFYFFFRLTETLGFRVVGKGEWRSEER